MNGIGLARIEYLAFFLRKLNIKIYPEFVIAFRRKREALRHLEKDTWKTWNLEINKVLTEEELNWKWDITDRE